jgi:hypothetical protein
MKRNRQSKKKQEFLKTELEPIKKDIIENAKKFGKTMWVRYYPPKYILAKFSLKDIQNILSEEFEGFTITWTNFDVFNRYFSIVYDVTAHNRTPIPIPKNEN